MHHDDISSSFDALSNVPIVFCIDLSVFLGDEVRVLTSIEGLRDVGTDDMIGFYPCDSSFPRGMPFKNAVHLLDERGGYISGWEYQAGDEGLRFARLMEPIEQLVSPYSWLFALSSESIPMAGDLDLVMKWMFISKGRNAHSQWHTDPIGSCAFMLQLCGTKKWTVKLLDDTLWVHYLRAGELLLLPCGLEHKVENIGDELNVAITHNWVDTRNMSFMWKELERGLSEAVKFFENNAVFVDFYDHMDLFREQMSDQIDNLLFGLIMIVFHMAYHKMIQFEHNFPAGALGDSIRSRLNFLMVRRSMKGLHVQ